MKPIDVVSKRERDGSVVGIVSLNEHAPGYVTAACSPRDLNEQLECALGRAEVREGERSVGVDDAHERHVRQIVTLRHHLRSDEDVDLARAHRAEHLFDCASARDVAVLSARPRARRGKRRRERLF